MKFRFFSAVTAFALTATMFPYTVFAVSEHDGQVHVIVENTTFTPESDDWDDSFWYGELVDTWVTIDDDSSMMSCVVAALDENGYSQTGAENNYISSINGLGEFDGGFMSGWMGTLNDWFTNEGFGAFTVANGKLEEGDEICIMYTCAYGDDLGGSWSNSDTTIKSLTLSAGTLTPAFDKDTYSYTLDLPANVSSVVVTPTASNKNYQVRTRIGDTVYKRTANVPVSDGTKILVECNYAGSVSMNTDGEAQTYTITVQQKAAAAAPDYSTILQTALARLAVDIPAPNFGSTGGEWCVLDIARGGYYARDNAYFTEYYQRIVETVNETAAGVNQNGALHKVKSTENSRLILALTAFGQNPESVGDWNLITPFDNFTWIKKQGINGPIWALIALDSHGYQTTDATIRQQCIDFILSKQTADGGWALSGTTADPDITSMTLQALARYTDQTAVQTAVDKAVARLSEMQEADGGYTSWGSVNSESIAQVIVACAALGIDAGTDPRFVKNGKSAVDALLSFYAEDTQSFKHIMTDGGNAMATDQAIYALIAYDRFLNGKTALYDMSDVTFAKAPADGLTAALGLPQEISSKADTTFNAVINIDGWDNAAGYKLMDCIVDVPAGLTVESVTMGQRVSGGQLSWHHETAAGKLRIVYFDPEKNESIQISGDEFPAEFFIIGFKAEEQLPEGKLTIEIPGMSLKITSDPEDETALSIVDTTEAIGTVTVVNEISFSACVLYQGDGIDLIPENKMAVCVSVANLEKANALLFSDGTNQYDFLYNDEITKKTGVLSYLALVDSSLNAAAFVDADSYTLGKTAADTLTFGDANGDGVINAQDALNAVNFWLRKSDVPDDTEILRVNVNCDSRVNTFDALGIVEHFVHGSEYIIVNKAAMAYK